jgi:hypothetical protein
MALYHVVLWIHHTSSIKIKHIELKGNDMIIRICTPIPSLKSLCKGSSPNVQLHRCFKNHWCESQVPPTTLESAAVPSMSLFGFLESEQNRPPQPAEDRILAAYYWQRLKARAIQCISCLLHCVTMCRIAVLSGFVPSCYFFHLRTRIAAVSWGNLRKGSLVSSGCEFQKTHLLLHMKWAA